jgi:hypothetical protein
MRRVLLALIVVGFAIPACSQQTAEPASPTAPTSVAEPSIPPGSSAADNYCRGVDEFIATSKAALKDPLEADTKDITAQARSLQEQATALAGELINDPDGIAQAQACTEKLQEFNAGN